MAGSRVTLTSSVAVLLAITIGASAACGDDDGNQSGTPSSPQTSNAQANVAAIDNAKLSASHVILDSVVQSSSAQATTYAEALQLADLVDPLVSPFGPASETPVWLVYLTGLFYEPQGPPVPGASSEPPQEPTCSRITVILSASTYESFLLNLAPAGGCSRDQ